MRILLQSFLLTLTVTSYCGAQQLRFTDSSNVWTECGSYYNEHLGRMVPYTNIFSLRDTVVGEERFSYFNTASHLVPLLFKEDTFTKRVFGKLLTDFSPSGYIDFVLYDFNMEEGDTLFIPSWTGDLRPHVCTEVFDDVLINDVPHRAFQVYNGCSYTVIEGVGSLVGVLDPIEGCYEYSKSLCCFENSSGNPVFSDYFSNDCLLSSSDVNKTQLEVRIVPNPASDFIKISSSRNLDLAQFTIYDIVGRIVSSGNLSTDTRVNISELQSGIFLLKLSDFEGNLSTARFLKK
jgi:hypothetical protein